MIATKMGLPFIPSITKRHTQKHSPLGFTGCWFMAVMPICFCFRRTNVFRATWTHVAGWVGFELTDEILQVSNAYWAARWRHLIVFIFLLLSTMMMQYCPCSFYQNRMCLWSIAHFFLTSRAFVITVATTTTAISCRKYGPFKFTDLTMYRVFQYYLWGYVTKQMGWSETAQWNEHHFTALLTKIVLRFCKLSSHISIAIFKVCVIFTRNKQQARLPQSLMQLSYRPKGLRLDSWQR